MSVPIYFLPNVRESDLVVGNRLNRAVLKERGIDHVFDDAELFDNAVATELVGRGPGGLGGTILFSFTKMPPVRSRYLPDMQDWEPVGDPNGLWIGIDKLDNVRPEDIARRVQLVGHPARLSDGQNWNIPVYRRATGSKAVPFELYRDAKGQVVTQVKPGFESRWREAGVVWDRFTVGDGAFDWEFVLDYAVEAIGTNYRFDHNLQRRLKLVDSTNWESVLAATIELHEVERIVGEMQQKKSG